MSKVTWRIGTGKGEVSNTPTSTFSPSWRWLSSTFFAMAASERIPTVVEKAHCVRNASLAMSRTWLPVGLLTSPQGLPSGPQGLPSGPHGLPSGPHGLPSGPQGLPSGPHGLPPTVSGGLPITQFKSWSTSLIVRLALACRMASVTCWSDGPLHYLILSNNVGAGGRWSGKSGRSLGRWLTNHPRLPWRPR